MMITHAFTTEVYYRKYQGKQTQKSGFYHKNPGACKRLCANSKYNEQHFQSCAFTDYSPQCPSLGVCLLTRLKLVNSKDKFQIDKVGGK